MITILEAWELGAFAQHPTFAKLMKETADMILTEGLAESVVGAEGAPRAFILKLGYFGSIL